MDEDQGGKGQPVNMSILVSGTTFVQSFLEIYYSHSKLLWIFIILIYIVLFGIPFCDVDHVVTCVQSNTILSSSSSLFTFLVSLVFLGETFTWVKLISVLLCMGGTIIVSLGDSESGSNTVASNALLGDVLSLVSAAFYSVYITLIRKYLPDDDDEKSGQVSMAQVLGFLGLFNLLIFLPVALVLNFTELEPFNMLTWKQFGLIVGKGMFI